MRKYLIYSTVTIIGLITIFIIYFSTYGIKTERFNSLILEKIKTYDSKLSIDINDVFLKLNVDEKSIKINTENSKLNFNNKFIDISSIDINLDILKFLKKENSIKTIKISTKKNKIKKITSFLNSYKFSIPRLIIYDQIEDGFIEADININYLENSKAELTYNVVGKISEGKLNVLNKIKIKDIDFLFNIEDGKYNIKNTKFNYEKIDFSSKEILIEKLENNYKIKGDIANKKQGLIDPNILSKIFNFNLDFLENKKILASTNNKFIFKINSKNKIKDLNLDSIINFKEILINKKIQNLISLQNGNIISSYKKNNLNVNVDSGYSFLKDSYKNNQKDKINIKIVKKNNENFEIEALIKNENNSINTIELSKYIKLKNKIIKDQDIIFGSDNQIFFSINDKYKVENLKVKSKLNLDKILVNYKLPRLNKIFPSYKNIFKIKNALIDIDFSKNKAKIFSKGDYSFNDNYDKFNFEIFKNKNDFIFDSKVEIVANPIILNDINYEKKKNIFSEIKFNGKYFENQEIKFENINLIENQNNLYMSNLYLSNRYKIIDFDELQLNYLNDNKKLNQLNVLKENKRFNLTSISFDGKSIIKNLLKGESKSNIFNRFQNLNSEIILSFEQFFIDDKDYLKNIRGNLIVKKNKVKYGNITAKLNNKNDFNLNIKTNSKNEKITNLIIDKPEPFVKHYKFIKGFNDGNLSYNSIEKNGVNKSKLKIFDFKVKEVPVLAKILTLASLQGIADLLTGEGIRFNDFEMDYESSKNLTEIKEIYAIGPAISILMSGYIEKEKLISLRGTLVPATTVNKTIAKIPLIGDLLVGKKTGEGVFGVSFKIKGPPKDLKTTVNPVKTLTPRFITRTLEKLKKN
tara:strand:- start:267 stop:2855 length:2589 start_codon:yes stop_codon:yes gene_type:complete